MKKCKKILTILAVVLCIGILFGSTMEAYAASKLKAPENFTGSVEITEEYQTVLTLTWDKVSGATGYKVFCREFIEEDNKWTDWDRDTIEIAETMIECFVIDEKIQLKVCAFDDEGYGEDTDVITVLGGTGIVENPTLKLNVSKKTLNVGNEYTLKLDDAPTTVTWKSSNKKIATVSDKGVVTAKKKGSCTITATCGGNKYTCKITVKQPTANSLYKEILKKGKHTYKLAGGRTMTFQIKSYVYVDLDQDGTKELIVSNYDGKDILSSGTSGFVFSYQKGKIVASDYLDDILQPNGTISYNKKYKGILSTYHPFVGMRAYDAEMYVCSKGKMSAKYQFGFVNMDTAEKMYAYVDYYTEGKKVSESKYDKFVDKYYNPKNCKSHKLKLNTN